MTSVNIFVNRVFFLVIYLFLVEKTTTTHHETNTADGKQARGKAALQ